MLKTLLEKGTPRKQEEAEREMKRTRRTNRQLSKTPSYKEQSSEDSFEEEGDRSTKSKIISSKRINKKLKVIMLRVDDRYCEAMTFAFGENSPSPMLVDDKLVMQPSSLQVVPKQLLEEDSPSCELLKTAD